LEVLEIILLIIGKAEENDTGWKKIQKLKTFTTPEV
jgi:hypothetical protein